MHHSHVYEDFLLLYILFAKRIHEHEGTFPIFTSFSLIFFPYLLPLSNVRFRGRELSPKGRKSFDFIAYFWGHVYHQLEYLVFTLYTSSQSWHSCDLLFLLCLVDVLVLSNLVYSGSSLPKPAQDHKVSICITLMCMKISC